MISTLPPHCTWVEYPNAEAQANSLAHIIADTLLKDVQQNGKASCIVPGGSTPKLLFQTLNSMPLPWDKITFSTTDERCVAVEDAHSNVGMLMRYMPNARCVALYPNNDAEKQYREMFVPVSVLVLGMGEDGHIASLFPDHDIIPENTPYVEVTAPVAPYLRISMTYSALLAVPQIHVLMQGDKKRDIIEAYSRDIVTNLPIYSIIKQKGRSEKTPLLFHYA